MVALVGGLEKARLEAGAPAESKNTGGVGLGQGILEE